MKRVCPNGRLAVSQNAPSIMTDIMLRFAAGRLEGDRMGFTTLLSLQEAWVRTVVWDYAAGISGTHDFRDSGVKH